MNISKTQEKLRFFKLCCICHNLLTFFSCSLSWSFPSLFLCSMLEELSSTLNFSHLLKFAAATAKLLQSCPTLCDPIDGSPPGSPIPGILQARTLEWVAISFSNAWKWKVKVKSLSRVWLFAIPWTAAYQAPPSMGFSRQEYWSGVPLPSPLLKFTFRNNVRLRNFSSIYITDRKTCKS